MKETTTNELQKLYNDTRINPILVEICEYYASKQDYEDGSYSEEIEPPEIVEPVYTLFLLQRRETILDELRLISRRYPSIFAAISLLYEEILIHMDIRPLEEEKSKILSDAIGGKYTPQQLLQKIEELTDNYEELSEALDKFYSWLHR